MYGPGNCYDMIVDCNIREIDEVCSYADNFCYQEVEYVWDIVTGRDEYDIRYLTPDPFPPTYYVDYLNTPEVQVSKTLRKQLIETTTMTNPHQAAIGVIWTSCVWQQNELSIILPTGFWDRVGKSDLSWLINKQHV